MLCSYCGAKSGHYKGECPRCPPGAMERKDGSGAFGYSENVRLRKWAERRLKKCKLKKLKPLKRERSFLYYRKFGDTDVSISICGYYEQKRTREEKIKQKDDIVSNTLEDLKSVMTYTDFEEDMSDLK